jgi:hypothetical protein
MTKLKISQKICINEQRHILDETVKNLNIQAIKLTELLKNYNGQPILEPILSADQLTEFLKDPITYYDQSILRDTGLSYSEKAQPSPAQVGRLYNLPYDEITRLISTTPRSMDNLLYDESDQTIKINESTLPELAESFKEYLTDEAEIREWLAVQSTCDTLNAYFKKYNVPAPVVTNFARQTYFLSGYDHELKRYTLRPYLNAVRSMARHGSIISDEM